MIKWNGQNIMRSFLTNGVKESSEISYVALDTSECLINPNFEMICV